MRHEKFLIADPGSTRRIARLAAWLSRLALLLLLAAFAAHRFGRIGTPEFFWLLAAGALLALLVMMVAIAAIRRAWRLGEPGSARAGRALVLALLLLAPFLFAGWLVVRLPALDDLATDPSDPPQFSLVQNLRSEGMNPLDRPRSSEIRQQLRAYPEVTGRRYFAAPDTAEAAAQHIMRAYGWQLGSREATGEAEITLEATGRSSIFGFPFDLAVRITDEGETSYVDARSAIRYGPHDLGANARRINAFMAAMDIEMANRTGAGGTREEVEEGGG